ncbi:hypothetical protein AB0L40_01110 [Patulibacter sp. NPDC049589]|uniref:hypothetical protein n=1 Tax=Patulibacter sp. NPDC049589 TaxID=3154731 RepID=UPI003445921A
MRRSAPFRGLLTGLLALVVFASAAVAMVTDGSPLSPAPATGLEASGLPAGDSTAVQAGVEGDDDADGDDEIGNGFDGRGGQDDDQRDDGR